MSSISAAEEDGRPFEDGRLTDILLGPEGGELVSQLAGKRAVIVVPSQGGKELVSDATTFYKQAPSLCFTAGAEAEEREEQTPGQQFVSLAGDRSITVNEAQVIVECRSEDGLRDEEESDRFDIERSFTIDTDALSCKVILIRARSLNHPQRSSPPPAAALAKNPAPSVDSIMSPAPDASNPWRDTFLGKLRSPLAEPVIKDIKGILRKLLDESRSSAEKSSLVQHFYPTFQAALASHPSWQEASREEVEGSMDAVEKYIFGKCYTCVFQPSDEDDAVQDRLFVEKCRMLSESGFSLSMLMAEPGPATIPDVEPDFATFEEAIDALLRLDQVQSPQCKLDALMAMVKGLAKAQDNGSADLLVPTLVWIVVKTCPPTLISDVRYIQRFRDHSRLTGEAAFCLTSVIAVITAVEKLHAERISKTDPIYSMIASQDLAEAKEGGGLRNEGSSSLGGIASKPLAELNSVASSVINTIGFVPRAIGSAVVDTFRSRSNRASKEASTGASPLPRLSVSAVPSASPTLAEQVIDPQVVDLRRRIGQAGPPDKIPLSVEELCLVLQDYRRLLAKCQGMPNRPDSP